MSMESKPSPQAGATSDGSRSATDPASASSPTAPVPTSGPVLPAPMTSGAIKAFVHPLRTAMYQYLDTHGSATASHLARAFGESTGQTSYHLRQLERHGLIEDDPDKADVGGRERWWRTASFSLDPRVYDDPAAQSAATAALRAIVADRARTLQAWFDQQDAPDRWMDVALHRQSTVELTLEEFTALGVALNDAAEPVLERAKRRAAEERVHRAGVGDSSGQPERRRVRVYLDAFPLAVDD